MIVLVAQHFELGWSEHPEDPVISRCICPWSSHLGYSKQAGIGTVMYSYESIS